MKMPTLFISHESPYLWDTASPFRQFLTGFGQTLPQPKAILLVSAHWNTTGPAVSSSTQPTTIHDFGGFPDHYYQVRYPAPGAPWLAERVKELIPAVQVDPQRGMDHAVWIPAGLMFPDAEIPVVSFAVQPRLPPKHHFELGQRLALLRDEGVLILASGAATHNLRAFFGDSPPQLFDPPAKDAVAFNDWLKAGINDPKSILDYRKSAPFGSVAHPTTEHFLPLIVAMGAGQPDHAVCIFESFHFSHFAMTSFQWG